MKIGIIGAGHAGVAAAQEAIKYGVEVTLFYEKKFLPYHRPRITSIAFRQTGENDIFMHPEKWYFDNKIKLVLTTKIIRINTDENSLITEHGESYKFDKIIITTGARPIIPSFANTLIRQENVSPLWTMQDALVIRKKVASAKHIAIVGGGVIGVESALNALDAGLDVTIIEKASKLMIRNLSPRASYTLTNILKRKGIKLIMSAAIEKIYEINNSITIKTNSEEIYAELVLLSIGGIPNTKIAGLSEQNSGIEIDSRTMTHLLIFLLPETLLYLKIFTSLVPR